jgi:muramoyltetrapeptide carboxypeptidase
MHGKILFVEDVNKAPYQIDRMLTHLRNAGKLNHLKGIVFADMSGCERGPGNLWEIVADLFRDAPFPIVYGVRSGHGEVCLTLPLGARVRLDAEKGRLHLLHQNNVL